MDGSAETFSPQIYANYPVLDSVLIYYLDIESIVQRHDVNPEVFETQGSLNLLAHRFDLPSSTTFQDFLDRYDAKYATVRSYFLPGANPKAIMFKAAEAGNLQAFYLGLRRNPKYKNPKVLKEALQWAARGDHQVMIDLIKDLGGTSSTREAAGAAEGGHLKKLKRLITHGKYLSPEVLFDITMEAIRFGQVDTVKYLVSRFSFDRDEDVWSYLFSAAGESGDEGLIECVISRYGDNYAEVIQGAIYGGHLELVMHYMEKLVARDHGIDQAVVNNLMAHVRKSTSYDIIEYLISLGGDNYNGLVKKLAENDQIELFQRYYLSPGVNYDKVFNTSLKNSSVKVVNFMLEEQLVPVTEEWLNRYVKVVGFNPELVALLFSLGATDYPRLVKRALIRGELALAKKYFDRAPGLRLNAIFKRCSKISVYQYLMSQGSISQKTVNATLARLNDYNMYVKAKNYLRSLNLQDGSSSSHSSSSDSD
jgi:hypothetical protein